MFTFRNRKISRDEFRARSKKRFNFLSNENKKLKSDPKKDLEPENFISGEKLPKK